jgi:N-acetylneuraminic acid mutarotase
MVMPREGDSMTLLPDGRVLISGGHSDWYVAHASAEIFDPAAGPNGAWSATGTMSGARNYHISVVLPDGDVLVAGGEDDQGLVRATAEIWSPSTGAWKPAAPMFAPRNYHSALLMANGLVLVSGGGSLATGTGALRSAEAYDPATGTWRRVRSMQNKRQTHAAVLLPGRQEVLVFGGYDPADMAQTSSERFDPFSPESPAP